RRRERAGQFIAGELDLAQLAVVAHAQHAVSEPSEALLGAVDPGERLGLDRGAVRQPRGETRRGRLLRARNPERSSELPYLLLADPGREQRMDDTVLLGRP